MATSQPAAVPSIKSKRTAFVLSLLLGTLGIHRFYLRQYIRGTVYALFCWTYVPTFLGVFDAIYFALMGQKKFDALYNGIPLPAKLTHCALCKKKLNAMNKPMWGMGKLTDGGNLCYNCFANKRAQPSGYSIHKQKNFQSREDEDIQKKQALTAMFTEEFYQLLQYHVNKILPLSEKLQNDTALAERLKDFPLAHATRTEFINGCVVWDMVKTVHLLTAPFFKASSIEATGMSLLIIPLLPNKISPSLSDAGYLTLVEHHKKGQFKSLATSIYDIGNEQKPLMLDMKTSDNTTITSDFTLPAFLKLIDSPLYDEYASHLYRFATIISKADGKETTEEVEKLKYIYAQTHNPLCVDPEINAQKEASNSSSLDEVLDELNSLIGMEAVKTEVNSLVNFIRIQKARIDSGLKASALSYHIVFTGNPGTGKTTVARIVAKIYKHLGLLQQGHLVETDRSGLIAEYTGQTAVKVNKVVDSALNGVLFIDEAYSLVGENKDDFGREAVATLIKRMEDDRERLVIILAGYNDEMDGFIHTNPGLKSRFNRYIHFPDYPPFEMMGILKSLCQKLDFTLTHDAEVKVLDLFSQAFASRDKTFGNGRYVRNIFEKMQENQANRIAKERVLNVEVLSTIHESDVPVSPALPYLLDSSY